MIFYRNSKPVRNRLIHSVSVYLITESLISLRNRRPRKTYKCSVRKSLFQHFSIRLGHHCFHIVVSVFAELYLFSVFKLCSMRFVGKTNDV